MNKKELIEALKGYPDSTEIIIWTWTDAGAKRYYTNRALTNDPVVRPESFELFGVFEMERK